MTIVVEPSHPPQGSRCCSVNETLPLPAASIRLRSDCLAPQPGKDHNKSKEVTLNTHYLVHNIGSCAPISGLALQRLSSRHSFMKSASGNPADACCKLRQDTFPPSRNDLPLYEHFPVGSNLPWFTWKDLNALEPK